MKKFAAVLGALIALGTFTVTSHSQIAVAGSMPHPRLPVPEASSNVSMGALVTGAAHRAAAIHVLAEALVQAEADRQAAGQTAQAAAAEKARQRATRRTSGTASSGAVVLNGDRFDRLALCESGGDPTTNTGNGFYGAFQFTASSWRSAWERGGFGDKYGTTDEAGVFHPAGAGLPIDWSYGVQKEVAMFWASITTPSRQWPVCWPRSA